MAFDELPVPSRAILSHARHPVSTRNGRPGRGIGERVLDLFFGWGSTLVAAERLERRCLGMEIDPRYCDAIVRRYLAFVGGGRAPDQLLERYGMPSENRSTDNKSVETTT